MDLAYRLLVYFVAMVGPTLLFLGLMRALTWLRDDALLIRIAQNEDTPPNVSRVAANAVEKRDDSPRTVSRAAAQPIETETIRTDGGRRNTNSVVCSACGETNRDGMAYCQQCVAKLN